MSLVKDQESQEDAHNDSYVETEVIKIVSEQEENTMVAENPDNMQDHALIDDLTDELIDMGTISSPVASQSAGGGSRRKLRMIIDPDDED